MFVGFSLAVTAVGLVISFSILFLASPLGGFGLVKKVKVGLRRSVSNDSEGLHQSAEIGKISILGTRLSGSRWT